MITGDHDLHHERTSKAMLRPVYWSIPHEDAVHCLDWHRRVNTAHLHGFKDDFPSYVVSGFLYLPRIRLLVHRAEPLVWWRA